MKDATASCLALALITTNETWKIYSRHCGPAFIHRISFRTWRHIEGRTCENEVQQKIREIGGRSRARCQFTRVHAGPVGHRTASTGTALPVEKQHRDDHLLDRRKTVRQ